MEYDLKISGGTIIDGLGTPGRTGDIGVKDGRIVAVGDAPGGAKETIDASGAIYYSTGLLDPAMTGGEDGSGNVPDDC